MPTQEEIDLAAYRRKLIRQMFRSGWNKYETRITTFEPIDMTDLIKPNQMFYDYHRAATNIAIDAQRIFPESDPLNWDKPLESRSACLKRVCLENYFCVSWTGDGRLKNEGILPLEIIIVSDNPMENWIPIILQPGDVCPALPSSAKAFRIGKESLGGDPDLTQWKPDTNFIIRFAWFQQTVVFPDATPLILL